MTDFQEKKQIFNTDFWQNVLAHPEYSAFVKVKPSRFNDEENGTIYFGVADRDYGWVSIPQLVSAPITAKYNLNDFPNNPTRFNFYLGGDCENLLQAFVNSDYINTVEDLFVGTSSFGFGKGFLYDKLTEILSQAQFPKLKNLSLGDCYMHFNGNPLYADGVGNITQLLQNAPNIKILELYGKFTLDKPIEMLNVTEIYINFYHEFTETAHFSQQSLNNFLLSSFPNLTKLTLYIENWHDENGIEKRQRYTLPDKLFNSNNFPKLKEIIIDDEYSLVDGEFEKLKNSDLVRKNNIQINKEKLLVEEKPKKNSINKLKFNRPITTYNSKDLSNAISITIHPTKTLRKPYE